MEQTGVAGILIRLERTRRGWSQDGLCRGICAVSYLSKIEQGKVQLDGSILSALFQRLDKIWHDDDQTIAMGKMLTDDLYEAVFTRDFRRHEELLARLNENWQVLSCSPFLGDVLALRAFWSNDPGIVIPELVPLLNPRQRCLLALAAGESMDAWNFYPCAATCYYVGAGAYNRGDYTQALEYSQRAFDLASREGSVFLMMFCQLIMGNCYSDLGNKPLMTEHNRIVERIARALGDTEMLRVVHYNTMATLMEQGEYAEPYAWFSTLEDPEPMDLHKLAVCCEKLGKTEEAFSVLERAEGISTDGSDLALQMCALVRYRLEHPDYLQLDAYGKKLMEVFERIRKERPMGYARFHLSWVLEWLTATRQYRQAYELMRSFTK